MPAVHELCAQVPGVEVVLDQDTKRAHGIDHERAGDLVLIADAGRRHHLTLLLMFDLDHFKTINDAHGHAVGDAVLVEAARRMSANLRPSDLVARIGGEEFLVVMPDTSENTALLAAERLRSVISKTPFTVPGLPEGGRQVTASIGVALPRRTRAEPPEILLDRADRALYVAKNSGRNQVALAGGDCALLAADPVCPPPRAAAAGP